MSATGPQADPITVCDTVVVNYFLAVGRFDLLVKTIEVVLVPRVVFDPDEPDGIQEEALSELRRGLLLHRRRAKNREFEERLRKRSEDALPHFEGLDDLVKAGQLAVVDLDGSEQKLWAELQETGFTQEHGVLTGLGSGEAAALAIASSRGWRFGTDDEDAMTVASALIKGFRPLRIRSLLRLAVDLGLISLPEARSLHRLMKEAGFWDKGRL